MSRKEDLLFLKIAISNGLLSETHAQKALAVCDKRETQDGRRPLVGAVLSKHNLMRTQEVKRIYGAIQKRTGNSAGPARAPQRPVGARVGARVSRVRGSAAAAPAVAGREAPAGSIDPTTLWMGIIAGIVLVGVVITMIVVIMRPAHKEGPKTAAEPAPEATTGVPAPSGEVAKPSTPKSPAETAAPSARREISEDAKHEVLNALSDGRRDLGEDPKRGLASMMKLKADLEQKHGQGSEVSAYLTQVTELIAQLETAVKDAEAAGGGEALGVGKPGDSPAGGDATAEKPEETPAPPEVPEPEAEPEDAAGDAEKKP